MVSEYGRGSTGVHVMYLDVTDKYRATTFYILCVYIINIKERKWLHNG